MESGKNFCNFLSSGLFITDKGDFSKNLNVRPCCYFKESTNFSDYEQGRENWKSITDWTDNCAQCSILENKKKDSYRNSAESYYDPDNKITMLEIDYSNLCNAACGICRPMNSNLIGKFLKQEGSNKIIAPTVSQKKFFDAMEQLDFSHVKTIRFRGGEPLIQQFHLKILEKIENKKAEIEYFTNGSNFPDQESWDAWKDFNVKIVFSIDGIGKKFEYIRTPLSWDQVSDNMNRIMNMGYSNITYDISYTINPLNLYYHHEIFKFFLNMRKKSSTFNIRMHHCFEEWGLENTTPKLREMFKKKYNSDFSVSKMLDELPFEEWKYTRFLNAIKVHEKRFNVNGAEVFPEIWDLAIINQNL